MTIRENVQSILKEIKPNKNLEGVTDIVEGGYLDSFEIMVLISKLSDAFGIEISVEDIVPENFNSVEEMTNMVERLTK